MTTGAPPDLQNYDFVRELGHGGFADVFLYRQRLPSREVAVKVLNRAARTPADREGFENEANRMAALSSHPGVVTIYDVGTAPDGRLYLTMEYCPFDHFGGIVRDQPLSTARTLEVGVKVSAAVEAAHRAGILHRDIKPANILLTAHREPALTDFGIAGGRDGNVLAESQGMSIHFAAPEVISGESAGDELGDVYSLGATIYALLAGRSPFGSPTGGDTDRDIIARKLAGELPPLDRRDVPSSLQRVLATAMARSPQDRFPTAAALGRGLQGVEVELGLAQTPLRLTDIAPEPARRAADDDDGTRFRGPQRIDPDAGSTRGRSISVPISSVPDRYAAAGTGGSNVDLPVPSPPPAGHTVPAQRRAGAPGPETASEGPDDERSSRVMLLSSVAGGVLLALVAGFVLFGSSGGADAETSTTSTSQPELDAFLAPTSPAGVMVERVDEDTVAVRWQPTDRSGDESYRVGILEGPGAGSFVDVGEPEHVIDGSVGRVCVEITTIRGDQLSSTTEAVCTDD